MVLPLTTQKNEKKRRGLSNPCCRALRLIQKTKKYQNVRVLGQVKQDGLIHIYIHTSHCQVFSATHPGHEIISFQTL